MAPLRTYQYDGLGRRIRKETAGMVREYVYNGDHLVLEVDGQGRDLAEYVYYPGVDAPHSMRRRDAGGNWRTYYYLTEAPGHVVGLIDETGQVVREYAYTPFGEITETTPAGVAAVENPLTYTAREWDAEVGLYFYRARYYDPLLQRFISEDPIGLAGGLNLYGFADGDPVSYSDPYGLCPDKLKSSTNTCPGGLTDKEWSLANKSRGHMKAAAGERILRSLLKGEIRAYSDERVEYGWVPIGSAVIYINRTKTAGTGSPYEGNVFYSGLRLARTLLHEDRHRQQFIGMTRSEARAAYEQAGGYDTNSYEIDAYDYARRNLVP